MPCARSLLAPSSRKILLQYQSYFYQNSIRIPMKSLSLRSEQWMFTRHFVVLGMTAWPHRVYQMVFAHEKAEQLH